MASAGRPVLRRPVAMTLDREVCIECGACDAFMSGVLGRTTTIPITHESLEAMAQCPVGAIYWLEGEEPYEHRYDDA